MAIVNQCKAWIEQDTEDCGDLDKTKTWKLFHYNHTVFNILYICLLSGAKIAMEFFSDITKDCKYTSR